MNKEVIFGLLSLILYVSGTLFIFFGNSAKQSEKKDNGLLITSYSVSVLVTLLYYWGMGTFNIVNIYDLILILTIVCFSTFNLIADMRMLNFNRVVRFIFLSLTFISLYFAGGYKSVLTYFNV